jgi:hypothetical protein
MDQSTYVRLIDTLRKQKVALAARKETLQQIFTDSNITQGSKQQANVITSNPNSQTLSLELTISKTEEGGARLQTLAAAFFRPEHVNNDVGDENSWLGLLRSLLPLSSTRAKKSIKNGWLRVNSAPVETSRRVNSGDIVTLTLTQQDVCALLSKSKKKPRPVNNNHTTSSYKVLIGNLPFTIKEPSQLLKDLCALFSQAGTLVVPSSDIDMPREDRAPGACLMQLVFRQGRFRGHAIVATTNSASTSALCAMDGAIFQDRPLVVARWNESSASASRPGKQSKGFAKGSGGAKEKITEKRMKELRLRRGEKVKGCELPVAEKNGDDMGLSEMDEMFFELREASLRQKVNALQMMVLRCHCDLVVCYNNVSPTSYWFSKCRC